MWCPHAGRLRAAGRGRWAEGANRAWAPRARWCTMCDDFELSGQAADALGVQSGAHSVGESAPARPTYGIALAQWPLAGAAGIAWRAQERKRSGLGGGGGYISIYEARQVRAMAHRRHCARRVAKERHALVRRRKPHLCRTQQCRECAAHPSFPGGAGPALATNPAPCAAMTSGAICATTKRAGCSLAD